jgi:hypothetical protein
MIDNWVVAEMLAAQRVSERRKMLEQARRWGGLEPERRRAGLRHGLARALVRLGLRLDAEATRSALAANTSQSQA